MASSNDKFKESLERKSLAEIEQMLFGTRGQISAEKDLMKLSRLNSELRVLQEVRNQKMASQQIRRSSSTEKPALKSFDDYMNSKK